MNRHNPESQHAQPPQQVSLTQTLLEFAEPLLELEDPRLGRERLEEVLAIATLVWNAEVAREISGEEHTLAEAERSMEGMPPPVRATFERVIDLLAGRKREHYAGDLRAVGGFEVGPSGGDGRPQVIVQEVGAGDLIPGARGARRRETAPTSKRKPKRFVVDMSHYLPDDGLMGRLPRPARVLANHFGAIAAAASRSSSNVGPIDVPCRKRTGSNRCEGEIFLRRDRQDDRIDWECLGCFESGTIRGWRGTPWDLSQRKRELASLPPNELLRLRLSDADRRALELALGLHTGAVGALAAARPSARGWTLDASRREIEDLAVAASAEIVDGPVSRGSTRYDELADRLQRALGIGEAAQEAAVTADILCFRARSERDLIRGVARVEGAGVHHLSVVLADVEPRVRRELLVRSDTTLEELHAILQVAFGWTESHLHAFRSKGRHYMRADQDEDLESSPSHLATLLDVAPKVGDELHYEYDFGDFWEHVVQVAEVRGSSAGEDLPRCLYGEGAAPPEDVGGAGGYAQFLEALADPAHPSHAEYREWLGRPFDPRSFDLETTNRLLRQLGRWQG